MPTKKKTQTTNKKTAVANVTNLKLTQEAYNLGTAQATWGASSTSVSEYKVVWKYKVPSGEQYILNDSTSSNKYASQSIPNNAVTMYISVTPRLKHKNSTSNGTTVSAQMDVNKRPVTVPSLTVEVVEGPALNTTQNGMPIVRLSVNNYHDAQNRATHIEIQVQKTPFRAASNNTIAVPNPSQVGLYQISSRVAVDWQSFSAGNDFKFRARAVVRNGTTTITASDWSDWSDTVYGPYSPLPNNCNVRRNSDNSVTIAFTNPASNRIVNMECRLIEDYPEFNWATVERYPQYFQDTTMAFSGHVVTFTELKPVTYHIQARITGDSQRNTPTRWTNFSTKVIFAEAHDAPTTWSSATTAKVGERVFLYWTANSRDGSKEERARIAIKNLNTNTTATVVRVNTIPVDEDTSAHYVILNQDTDLRYSGECTLEWRVQTSPYGGNLYGPQSVVRTVKFYNNPSINASLQVNEGTNRVSGYPIVGNVHSNLYSNQTMLYYTVEIYSLQDYTRPMLAGNDIVITRGTTLYNGAYQVSGTSTDYEFRLMPNDLLLESGIEYSLKVVAVYSSGLTATSTFSFRYSVPDTDTVGAFIIDGGYDQETGGIILYPELDIEEGPEEGFMVYMYRVAYDGELVPLTDEPLTTNDELLLPMVADPHPTLTTSIYYLMIVNMATGAYSYCQIPIDINDNALVITWNEKVNTAPVNLRSDASIVTSTNMFRSRVLRLPYNVDATFSNKKDVVLAEYVGRSNPVSYYGTQQGYESKWTTEIPVTEDVSKLQTKPYSVIKPLLDELMRYDGDCYVRDASGVGFWASLSISYNKKHGDKTIQISIDAAKVEGGA